MKTHLTACVAAVVLSLSATGALAGSAGQSNSPSDRIIAPNSASTAPTPQSSLMILPVRVGGTPTSRVAEVVGLLLEQRGMPNLEASPDAFVPPAGVPMDAWTAEFRAFVRGHPVSTEYVLYAEFNGTPQTGLTELRAMVLTATGEEVWRIEQRAGATLPGSWSAREPMSMAALLARQLEPRFGLDESTAKRATPGRFAALMEQRSGLPPAEERNALRERQRQFAAAARQATFLIFPSRVGGAVSSASAVHVAQMLRDAGIGRLCSVAEPVLLPGSAPDPNQLRMVWDLARKFRDHARQHPPGTDYAVYVDYGYSTSDWHRGFVHIVVCDARGEWVIVDFQNSHHPDYQAVKPMSERDCDHLVLLRLQGYVERAAKPLGDASGEE